MKRILCTMLLAAMVPIGAMSSPMLDAEPMDEERIAEIADEVIAEDFSEFIELDRNQKMAVASAVAGLVDEAEFNRLRDQYFATVPEESPFGPEIFGCIPANTPNCGWWGGLQQGDRNYKIMVEALYAVDQDIWDFNLPCSWDDYYNGRCCVNGNWDYSCTYGVGVGGQCKVFVNEVLPRTSGGATKLPGGKYDYTREFPYRNKQDAVRYAVPGEILQFTGAVLHTAIIVENFHNGKFQVVDSNWCGYERIGKHVIDVYAGDLNRADCKSYVIGCYYQR